MLGEVKDEFLQQFITCLVGMQLFNLSSKLIINKVELRLLNKNFSMELLIVFNFVEIIHGSGWRAWQKFGDEVSSRGLILIDRSIKFTLIKLAINIHFKYYFNQVISALKWVQSHLLIDKINIWWKPLQSIDCVLMKTACLSSKLV